MSDEQQNEGGKGFTVADKRRFESDGTTREGVQDPERGGGADPAPEGDQQLELPDVDFSTFIFSLSTSVMVHLGETPHPDGTRRKDLVLAKQTIDILGMLKEKTEGNLNEEESKLLNELLYDLRLRYVASAS
jgi:hypothetical protein